MPGARTGGATGYRGIYQPVELANMLLGRKNPTFVEPEGWLPRLLHSFDRQPDLLAVRAAQRRGLAVRGRGAQRRDSRACSASPGSPASRA